jgi:MFS family permease
MAFLVVGLPGLLLALLVRFTMREPRRGQFDPHDAATVDHSGFGESIAELWRNRAFRLAAFACGFHALVLYGHGHWAPPYLGRVHAMPLSEIAFWLAILAVLPGALGIWISGVVSDRLEQRAGWSRLRIASISLLLLIPFEIAYTLASDAALALVLSAVTHFLGGFYLAPTIAFVHGQVGARQRASASAILLLCLNLIGLGVGPLFVGLISDLAAAQGLGSDGLRYAMLAIIPSQAVALILFRQADTARQSQIANLAGLRKEPKR